MEMRNVQQILGATSKTSYSNMIAHPLNVTSEIGKLKTVLLHRPGSELENITPDTMESLLFDDIPYLPVAQKEHDQFAMKMQENGVEVIYLEKLISESLGNQEIKNEFINRMLDESNVASENISDGLNEYLTSLPVEDAIRNFMQGIRKNDLVISKNSNHLCDMLQSKSEFYINPMPNLYFTRDPAATIGNGISINRMLRTARRRESLFMEYIMKHHPRFALYEIPIWFNRYSPHNIEGGDQLVLSKNVIAIGISERTSPEAIEELARNAFSMNSEITKVLAIQIPKKRAFMHLDTVFTMVDYDKFTIHPEIQESDGSMNIYILEQDKAADDLKVSYNTNLFETLKSALNLTEVELIPCGGSDVIASAREQWNDGSNTLAIAPGVVVTYDRNYVSNNLLRSHGIKVIEIASAELSRGRGGPRCMSMPIVREGI